MVAHTRTLYERVGRCVALMGVALPLLLIGHSKFAAFEVEALKPLIGGTPWLGWMYAVFGPVDTSRLMGVVEIATALLLMLVCSTAKRAHRFHEELPGHPAHGLPAMHGGPLLGRIQGVFVISARACQSYAQDSERAQRLPEPP
jgi:hypothetical protein